MGMMAGAMADSGRRRGARTSAGSWVQVVAVQAVGTRGAITGRAVRGAQASLRGGLSWASRAGEAATSLSWICPVIVFRPSVRGGRCCYEVKASGAEWPDLGLGRRVTKCCEALPQSQSDLGVL